MPWASREWILREDILGTIHLARRRFSSVAYERFARETSLRIFLLWSEIANEVTIARKRLILAERPAHGRDRLEKRFFDLEAEN